MPTCFAPRKAHFNTSSAKRSWLSGKVGCAREHRCRKDFFQGEPIVDFPGVAKDFSRVVTKNGEILFCPLKTKKTAFFVEHLIGKYQISKARGVLPPSNAHAPDSNFGRQSSMPCWVILKT